MTAFTNAEEGMAKSMFGGDMQFYQQNALERAGGRFSHSTEPFAAHVVVDRELITEQNPASTAQVAQELLKRLKYVA